MISTDEGRKTLLIMISFFVVVVAIFVYDFQKVVVLFFFPSIIYSLFYPAKHWKLLFCFDFVH